MFLLRYSPFNHASTTSLLICTGFLDLGGGERLFSSSFSLVNFRFMLFSSIRREQMVLIFCPLLSLLTVPFGMYLCSLIVMEMCRQETLNQLSHICAFVKLSFPYLAME